MAPNYLNFMEKEKQHKTLIYNKEARRIPIKIYKKLKMCKTCMLKTTKCYTGKLKNGNLINGKTYYIHGFKDSILLI